MTIDVNISRIKITGILFLFSCLFVVPSSAAEEDIKLKSDEKSKVTHHGDSDYEGPVESDEEPDPKLKDKQEIVQEYMDSYAGGPFKYFAYNIVDRYSPYAEIQDAFKDRRWTDAHAQAWVDAEKAEADPLLKIVCRYMNVKVRPINKSDFTLSDYYMAHIRSIGFKLGL